MKLVRAIFQPARVGEVTTALRTIEGIGGVMVSEVPCVDAHRGHDHPDHNAHIELLVPDEAVERVIDAIHRAAHLGRAGDGGIWVMPVERFVSIRQAPE